ncbi:MAG: hypothetical protein R3F46_03450 [bacterium]
MPEPDKVLPLYMIILEYLKVLIWPSTIAAVFLTYKKEIRNILPRMTKAEFPGGVSFNFSEKIEETKALSEKVENAPSIKNQEENAVIPLTDANLKMLERGLDPSPSGLNLDRYYDLAVQDANLALAGIRMELETQIRNLVKGYTLSDGRKLNVSLRTPITKLLDILFNNAAITENQWELARNVLQMCNAAIHGYKVSHSEAVAILDTASVLRDDYLEWLSWGFPENDQ